MSAADEIHAPNVDARRAYCGRKTKNTDDWQRVTCEDCKAARRADEETR